MEESNFKELRQKGFLRERSRLRNLILCGVAEFLAIHPLAHQDVTRTEIVKDFGNRHASNIFVQEYLSEPPLVGSFIFKVQLGTEKRRKYQ